MKQAVVLIHGIGEQKPMDTARTFVKGVLPPAKGDAEQYWSKPDAVSESFELRRLQAVGRNKIHFFEYYWASHIEGTTFRHLGQWLWQLLFRRPRSVPQGLKTVWWLSWLLLAGAVVAATLGWLDVLGSVTTTQTFGPASLLLVVWTVVQGFLIYYAGDAARYLSPTPQNIALRQRIRSEGVALLARLHESGDYDRIVVVGHSLGSVIGYDILTALWHRHNERYTFEAKDAQLDALMAANIRPQPVLRDGVAVLGEALRRLPDTDSTAALRSQLRHGFRQSQLACWHEQRAWGNPWRITDFITLGSPLAHAMMLLAKGQNEFNERVRQRELPTCPPVTDGGRYAYVPDARIGTSGGRQFSPLVPHHAACFAVTRWTNLYFPAHLGLFGDVIGGPLGPVFGAGVQDIAVTMRSLRRLTLAAHTTYWNPNAEAPPDETADAGRVFALNALKQALAFDASRDYALQEPATDEPLRDPMLLLNTAIDEGCWSDDAVFPADVLSPRFQYYMAGGTVISGPDPVALVQAVRSGQRPDTRKIRTLSVTPVGRSALVTFKTLGMSHLRLFSKVDGHWRLDVWSVYPKSDT